MSAHNKVRHAHHGAAPTLGNDTNSWVEGLTSLKADDGAVELLAEELNAAHQALKVAPSGGDAGGEGGGSSGAASVTLAEDFEATMELSLAYMTKEVGEMGEAMLEVGAPHGWGPVGLRPADLETVVSRLRAAAGVAQSDVTVLRERKVDLTTATGAVVECCVSDVLVRRRPGVNAAIEIRVAIIGNVDSGKSTLVGVLTRTMLDDGRGLARSKVFKHSHEEATGRTSSIGQHTLCLDSTGHVLNNISFRTQTCGEYVSRACKVITLVDLAGHEKYFRTTAYGLTGHMPDYAGLIVGANMGVVGMCKEHLGVALALKVPVFFVITKVDICPEHILKQTVQSLATILKKPGVRKKPFLVRTVDDVLLCARNMNTDSLAPFFLTSAVTGQGLDLVRMFYNLLPQRVRWIERRDDPPEFVIDEAFGVPGVGTVVAGTLKRGVLRPNDILLLGPDIADGSFKPVAIKSIHYKRLQVGQVVAGQTAALALKKIKRNQVRKGMALVHEKLHPKASWEIDADIAILTHSTTIQPRYQAVIHCEIIRQAARVVAMDRERLRSGDRAYVRFRFIQRPEYVTANTRFVFREGRTKGIGIVVGTEHEFAKEREVTEKEAAAAAKAVAAAAAAAGKDAAHAKEAAAAAHAKEGGGAAAAHHGKDGVAVAVAVPAKEAAAAAVAALATAEPDSVSTPVAAAAATVATAVAALQLGQENPPAVRDAWD